MRIFFSLLFFFAAVYCFGQNNPYNEVSIASPTAASLGKYGDIPVSYHTGIPSIDIPFYTVKEGTLSLPISISYHAGGMKVMEAAGWAGAGWSLNAGGVITRTVRGAPDEKGTSNLGQSLQQPGGANRGYFSDFGYQSYLWVPSNVTGNINGFVPDIADFQNGTIDGEPDLFFFNFGGYSGKFYFRDDRMPIIVPEQDFKIIPAYTGSGSIQSFVITTPDGVKYSFGKTASGTDIDPIEVTNPYGSQGLTGGTVISSWFLNNITSADNQFSINLSYVAENYSSYTISMFPLAGSDLISKEYSLVKDYVQGVRLSQISFSNGTVTFNPGAVRQDLEDYTTQTLLDAVNTQAKSLGSINVANSSGFCKKDSFYYSYFVDGTTALPSGFSTYSPITTDTKRLRLDSIREQSCDNVIIQPAYKFSYTAPSGSPNFAPRRLNFAQDHWGFYNGKTNVGLIPSYTTDQYTPHPGANRDASWPEMSYGELNKITYPTGGFTQLDFEANDVWLSYPVYTAVLAKYTGIGPGIGQTYPQTINVTTSSNPYRFTLDYHGGTAGSASYAGLSVNSTNPHAEEILVPGAGPQSYLFNGFNFQSGDYAEANIYEEVPTQYSGNQIVGGLRIKTITENDGLSANNNVVTGYSYQTNNVSTGILYSRPTYVQVMRSDLYKLYGTDPNDPNSTWTCSPNGCIYCDIGTNEYFKSPVGIRPMSTTQGNHIGYNEVHVTQTNNGYSLYRYYGSNFWDLNHDDVAYRNANPNSTPRCDPAIPNYPDVPLPFEYTRGELKYEAHYNQNGQVISDKTYYPVYQNSTTVTPGIVSKTVFSANNAFAFYELISAKKTQSTVVSRLYDNSGNAVTTVDSTFYGSLFHHQPTRKSTINSKGQVLTTKYTYSQDYRLPLCDTISDCSAKYASDTTTALNTLNTALFGCTTMGCRWTAFQNYLYAMSQARISYISCSRSNYANETSNDFKTCHFTAKTGAGTELKPILDLQDSFRIVPIETTSWNGGNLTHADFTRYDFVTSPANVAYPNKTQLIDLQAPSSTFTYSAVSGSTLTKDSRYADENIYSFSGGNLAYITPKAGTSISYIWDYLNKNPIAKIMNATVDQVAVTSFEADGKGGWTFSGTPVADATAPMGSKCYGLASGTISRGGLTSTATYIVSYWSKTGSSYTVTGSTAVKQGKTINGWTYFEHTVTAVSSTAVSGSGSIDELRLFPSTAQVNSYTYTPLVGITSECDANNRITYYFYDNIGRLKYIKDQDGNIIKTIQYHIINQTTAQ